MRFFMDSLPGELRNWLNGLQSLTMGEIENLEKRWELDLLHLYENGILTRAHTREAWETWQGMKADEIAYLESTP